MVPLHFHLAFVEALAQHRTPLLTHLFQGASAMGNAGFYVALIMLVYVAWDKRLAVRLSFLVLVTMAFNDLLKNMIRNPRPFIEDGIYRQRWAVSPAQAAALAAEYSTPSGHAMAASSFYSYLFETDRRLWLRIIAVLLILVIGFSRPYLGVHYGEDVLLGWMLGLAMAVVAVRYKQEMEAFWSRRSYVMKIALTVSGGFAMLIASAALNAWQIDDQLKGMTAYAGFLTGAVIACPLEQRLVRFEASSGGAWAKILRFMVAATLISAVLIIMKLTIAFFGLTFSPARFSLEYAGNAAAAFAGMFLAPWLFIKAGLADTEAVEPVLWEAEDLKGESTQEA